MKKKKKSIHHKLSIPIKEVLRYACFVLVIMICGFFLIQFIDKYSVQKNNPTIFTFDEYSRGGGIFNRQLREILKKTGDSNLIPVVFSGSRKTKKIALTFDADMTYSMRQNIISRVSKGAYDRRITDILQKTNTKATLFLAGLWIENYPEDTKVLAKNPLFELANHSYSHPAFYGYCYGLPHIAKDGAREEIRLTQKLLKSVAGVEGIFFRFPGGCYSQKDVDIAESEGLVVVAWDVVGGDGFNYSADSIKRNVIDKTENGSIIVLHMNGAPNAPMTSDALFEIIEQLKNKGFEFVKLSELLDF